MHTWRPVSEGLFVQLAKTNHFQIEHLISNIRYSRNRPIAISIGSLNFESFVSKPLKNRNIACPPYITQNVQKARKLFCFLFLSFCNERLKGKVMTTNDVVSTNSYFHAELHVCKQIWKHFNSEKIQLVENQVN